MAHQGPSPWLVMAMISLSAQMSRGSLSSSWSGLIRGLMGRWGHWWGLMWLMVADRGVDGAMMGADGGAGGD